MAVKIRLQRKGRKKAPFYFIVVADSRSPRDGRFIERIGSYNPVPKIAHIEIDTDKTISWLDQGAVPTKTVRGLLSSEGVLYKKHLLRGLKMNVLTQEDVDQKFTDFLSKKTSKIESLTDKFKAERSKLNKLDQEREAKANEQKAKEIMEKHRAEADAKRPKTEEAPTEEPEQVEPAEE